MARRVTVTAVLDYYMDDEIFDDMTDEEILSYISDAALDDLAGISADAIELEIHNV